MRIYVKHVIKNDYETLVTVIEYNNIFVKLLDKIFRWQNEKSVHRFMLKIIKTEFNHEVFNCSTFKLP